MNKKYKIGLVILVVLGIVATAVTALHDVNFGILSPQGPIAEKQRNLIVFASLLSLVVVVPVFVMTFLFAWRYRASKPHPNAKYRPDWDHDRTAETIWWVVPTLLIIILSVVAWNSSHQLDPFKPLASNKKPLTIQVVALQWKWLFIYPEQGIASVNLVQFPAGTPVDFRITSDAPMNSFWIPQLGGQIYAMSGMSTTLHLQADKPGSFAGVSANLSGEGFAGMKFTAKASSQADFDQWVHQARQTAPLLTSDVYNELAEPSANNKVTYYAADDKQLYDSIIMKFMMPSGLPTYHNLEHHHASGEE